MSEKQGADRTIQLRVSELGWNNAQKMFLKQRLRIQNGAECGNYDYKMSKSIALF